MKRNSIIICVISLAAIILIAAITVTVVLFVIKSHVQEQLPEKPLNRPDFIRVDCHPDTGKSPETCAKRGCQWLPGDASGGADCSFPSSHGYQVVDEPQLNKFGGSVRLRKLSNFTLFGQDVEEIQLDVTYISREIVRLKFFDPNNKRHEWPVETSVDNDLYNLTYTINFQLKPTFGIVVRRQPLVWDDFWAKPDQTELPFVFDSRTAGFIFSDQFLQMTSRLPSRYVYGLGDPRNEHLVHDLTRTWGLWTRESIEELAPGAHPFLMSFDSERKASGIYLRNSNALEMILQPHPAVTFRTIGGILDFYIFLGPTPEDVVKQYHRVIGYPSLPPYWALGLHFGRQIFNQSSLDDAIERMDKSGIPFDTVHLGHAVLKEGKGLTIDDINFRGLVDTVRTLHRQQGRRVTVSTWGAVSSRHFSFGNYLPLQEAKNKMMLIGGVNPLSGELNHEPVVYPDYSHSQAVFYWLEILRDFYQKLEFDSIHLELNSPFNSFDRSKNTSSPCQQNKYNFPPYKPQSVLNSRPLFTNTICLDGKQGKRLHYDLHNLYAHHQAKSAFEGLSMAFPPRRPFIITDSHAPGTGRYAAHFITNTRNLWTDFKRSLLGVLELNQLGIPAVGSDICGSYGNSLETPLLCRRWIQLGAFYPITRIFKCGNDQDQDLPLMGDEIMETAREAFKIRYELLPYLYTLFYDASTSGGTVARPLFHEFPSDNKTWSIEDQFLWGKGLLISPVMEDGPKFSPVYLPKARWFDYYTGLEMKRTEERTTIPRNDRKISLHVRGGHVITIHSKLNSTTTNNFTLQLIVALDENNTAQGSVYVDDKKSIIEKPPFGNGVVQRFSLKKDVLTITSLVDGYDNSDGISIDTVKFWGVRQAKFQIEVNKQKWHQYDYDSQRKVLLVLGLDFKINARYNDIRLRYDLN